MGCWLTCRSVNATQTNVDGVARSVVLVLLHNRPNSDSPPGRAARGVSGNDVSGYLSGNGLLSAVAGGHIAAATAAALLGRRLD